MTVATIPTQQIVVAVTSGGPVAVPTPTTVTIYGNDGAALAEHVADPSPHPAYDDLPDLGLLFENGLI